MPIPSRIAVTGEKYHGKDTAINFLKTLGQPMTTLRFADGIKAMLRAFYRMSGLDEETIERKIEGDLKEKPCEVLGGQTPRHALQTLGTEWRVLVFEPLLRKQLCDRVRLTSAPLVVPDMRYHAENGELLEAELGFFMIRVVRPKLKRNAASLHASERDIPDLLVHAEIINDGSIGDFADKMSRLLEWFQEGHAWPIPSKSPELVF